jgi:hypothetical protein
MKCAVHTEVEASGYCRNCGKPMCAACVRPVRDVFYCEDCLASIVGVPAGPSVSPGAAVFAPATATATSASPRVSSPGLPWVAFLLGLFPGLGAVYNGEYNKALIQIVVFASIIVGLNSDLGDGPETALSLLLAGFVLYMGFDAMRTAKTRSLGEAPQDPLEAWSKDRPIGPMILIAMGALFLLNNFGFFSFFHIHRLWPLVLIAVGVLMFRNRMGGRS